MKLIGFAVIAAVMLACNFGQKPQDSPVPPSTDGRPTPVVKPTLDKETVKNDLLSLENKLTEAAMKGDITTITQYTTDDFQLTDVNGKVQNRNKALADIKEEKSVRSWAITDAELVSYSEDSAVLQYVLNVTLKSGRSGRARVTDSFVRRDGKWMVKSEQQTAIR